MIFTSITRTLMASFAIFPTVFNTYEKRYRRFPQENTTQKTFLIPKFVMATIISNWTSCRTIQGVMVLVISRSSNLKLLAQLLPELYSSRFNQYYLLILLLLLLLLSFFSIFPLVELLSPHLFLSNLVNFLAACLALNSNGDNWC